MTTTTQSKLIHVGKIQVPKKGNEYLFLRKMDNHHFVWRKQTDSNEEKETGVSAPTIEEAIRLANREWKILGFRPLNCGFRYTLPERDEHGINALFHQMVASYSSSNGIYFDEDAGHNCFINFASEEARNLWHKLQKENTL